MTKTAKVIRELLQASTSGYCCFVVDDFRVNLESAPEGFIEAIKAPE